MKLFTIGPVQMYERTLNEKSKQIPYFRNQDFSDMMLETDKILKQLLFTHSDTHCMYLTGSGTAAMEAAIINTFSKKDKILTVCGGTFGWRFSDICNVHNLSHTDIDVSQKDLTKELLTQYDGRGYTGFLVNLNETSTGQLYNIQIIRDFCKRNRITLVVDAITTFLCDKYKMDEFGIDVSIISSQKGLCVSPGVAIVAINHETFCNKVLNNPSVSYYFNFKDYDQNMKRGQTPFTPAVGTLYEIYDFLKFIQNKGLDKHLLEIKERADYFREGIQSIGLSIPTYKLSNALTPVIFERPIAKIIYQTLIEEYSMVVNPTGGKNEDYQLRVSHLGNLNLNDYNELINAIREIIQRI